MKRILVLFGHISSKVKALIEYLIREYDKTRFASFGEDSYIGHNCIFSFPTVSVGKHTYIGSNCVFQSTHGRIEIGNHVMFGPGVHIHGGNHIIKTVGAYMDEVKKNSGDDAPVRIGDDVWFGANSMVLGGGIIIGKGAVIGAGSVVTKDVPPYSVMVGVPAKCIMKRFTDEQIIEHERILKAKNATR